MVYLFLQISPSGQQIKFTISINILHYCVNNCTLLTLINTLRCSNHGSNECLFTNFAQCHVCANSPRIWLQYITSQTTDRRQTDASLSHKRDRRLKTECRENITNSRFIFGERFRFTQIQDAIQTSRG